MRAPHGRSTRRVSGLWVPSATLLLRVEMCNSLIIPRISVHALRVEFQAGANGFVQSPRGIGATSDHARVDDHVGGRVMEGGLMVTSLALSTLSLPASLAGHETDQPPYGRFAFPSGRGQS